MRQKLKVKWQRREIPSSLFLGVKGEEYGVGFKSWKAKKGTVKEQEEIAKR